MNNLPIKKQKILLKNKSSFHLYIVLLELNKIKKNYNYIFNKLRSKGVLVNLHYKPIHLNPYYKKLGFKKGDFLWLKITEKEQFLYRYILILKKRSRKDCTYF